MTINQLFLLKNFVETKCAEARDGAPGANHECDPASSKFSVHFKPPL